MCRACSVPADAIRASVRERPTVSFSLSLAHTLRSADRPASPRFGLEQRADRLSRRDSVGVRETVDARAAPHASHAWGAGGAVRELKARKIKFIVKVLDRT